MPSGMNRVIANKDQALSDIRKRIPLKYETGTQLIGKAIENAGYEFVFLEGNYKYFSGLLTVQNIEEGMNLAPRFLPLMIYWRLVA